MALSDNGGTKNFSFKASATSAEQRPARASHKIELDPRRAMTATGVVDVPTFTDKAITVRLESENLYITGQGLSVKALDVDTGKLMIEGRITSLKYSEQQSPTSLVKRIFK